MPIQLTPAQQAVVDNEGGGLLVSAAAGSGKTRVLVDRLFRRVLGEEQADVDQFLIITYTRAAAAELRERIAQELTARLAQTPGDRHLRRQLTLIYRADIKTVDGFCASLLRENIHLLSFGDGPALSGDFRILDENEAELLRRRVLPRVLEEFYAHLTPGGEQLSDSFGFGRDDRALEDLVLELHGKILSHPYPSQWLQRQQETWANIPPDLGQTFYGQVLLGGVRQKARHWRVRLEEALLLMAADGAIEKSYAPAFAQGAALLGQLEDAAGSGWDAAAGVTLTWPKLSAVRKCENPLLKEKLQSLWGQCKKEMGKAVSPLSTDAATGAEELRRSAPAMEALLSLTAAFLDAYQAEKLRRGVTDFSDQEHYTVALLQNEEGEPTELAAAFSQRYREVMVDEYQDSNLVQDRIFTAISQQGRRLFCVGDVKQSIYRFRLADPTIFLEKYRAFPPAGQEQPGAPRKLLLSQNFRSRQSVLDAANFVFASIMSREMGELDYGDGERLYFGADYLPPREDCPAEFHLLQVPRSQDGQTLSRPLAEARFVAARVRAMLRGGFPVTDPETNVLRPCRAEDIAVLLRSPGPRLPCYAQAFAEAGIPYGTQEREDFFSTLEVAATLSLLEIVDNPRQDVPLIAVLRSPLYAFSPSKLALIRGNHPQGDFYEALTHSEDGEAEAFLSQLEELRREAGSLSVYHLLWRLYNRLNILGLFGAMEGGEARRENLIALTDHALRFEQAGYRGLFAFVSHLRFLLESGQQPRTASGSPAAGVRLLSIHKSKGLEFPIVIVADLAKPFGNMDLKAPVLVHPKLGLGPMYIDLDRRIRYPTAARDAVAMRLTRETRSEELRLLYVALTRAREKLILVASLPYAEKKLKDLSSASMESPAGVRLSAGVRPPASSPIPPETVAAAGSMAEWVLLPLLRRPEAAPLRALAGVEEGAAAPFDDTPWTVSVHDALEYAAPTIAREEAESTPAAEADYTGDPPTEAPGRTPLPFDPAALEYRYPYEAATLTPAKVTATQLKNRASDGEIAADTIQPYIRREFPAPRFLTGEAPLTAAQRGTATHLVLQHLPLDGEPGQVAASLLAKGLMTPEQAAAVDLDALRRFLASPLAALLRTCRNLTHEYRFSLLAEARDYFPDLPEGEQVLLQGVVDLFAEGAEGLVIVDFKTDHVTKETLPEKIEHYRPQLTAYSSALSQVLEKPVWKRVVYFLGTGDSAEV